jgi:hypothetical protein
MSKPKVKHKPSTSLDTDANLERKLKSKDPEYYVHPYDFEAEPKFGMLYGVGCVVVTLILIGAATAIKFSIDFLFT